MTIERLKEILEKEIKKATELYNSADDVLRVQLRSCFKLKNDAKDEEIQKNITKCKNAETIDKVQQFINASTYNKFDLSTMVRNYTWILNVITGKEEYLDPKDETKKEEK